MSVPTKPAMIVFGSLVSMMFLYVFLKGKQNKETFFDEVEAEVAQPPPGENVNNTGFVNYVDDVYPLRRDGIIPTQSDRRDATINGAYLVERSPNVHV
jgi:hypothetical protein